MRLSKSLIPTIKEVPAEAQIASHRLMLRAGLVRQMTSGIYAWLPAGLRVLNKIAAIVREEQDRAGAQELLMPTIQSADLWRESGRYDAYGKEMLRITDRHERELLYGPTNEEMITGILRDNIKSYRELPQNLYHIQWKFRDEVRPRFGVLRGREFLMKDAYSFDLDYDGAFKSYKKMLLAYMRTFQRIGITAIPMRADTGQIGGDLSHEFHVLAPTGESGVFYDAAFEAGDALAPVMTRWMRSTGQHHDLRRHRREARSRGMGESAGGAAARRARHRGRADFLLRQEVHAGDELRNQRPGRVQNFSGDGQLRHRRVAPGRRHHRGQTRRRRHHLAGRGGPVPRRHP